MKLICWILIGIAIVFLIVGFCLWSFDMSILSVHERTGIVLLCLFGGVLGALIYGLNKNKQTKAS